MTHKKGWKLKRILEWIHDSMGKELAIESSFELNNAYALVDWYNKKLGVGVLVAIEVLASYSPRRLEELDAQRQIEEGE